MTTESTDSAVAFATHLWSEVHEQDEGLADYAVHECQALGDALDRLHALVADADDQIRRAVSAVSEAAYGYACLAHADGVRVGVHAEQLRTALCRGREPQRTIPRPD